MTSHLYDQAVFDVKQKILSNKSNEQRLILERCQEIQKATELFKKWESDYNIIHLEATLKEQSEILDEMSKANFHEQNMQAMQAKQTEQYKVLKFYESMKQQHLDFIASISEEFEPVTRNPTYITLKQGVTDRTKKICVAMEQVIVDIKSDITMLDFLFKGVQKYPVEQLQIVKGVVETVKGHIARAERFKPVIPPPLSFKPVCSIKYPCTCDTKTCRDCSNSSAQKRREQRFHEKRKTEKKKRFEQEVQRRLQYLSTLNSS